MRTSLHLALLAFALTAAMGCTEDCTNDTVATCQETPPTDEACQAYFQRWFYDAESNACDSIGYSGCSQYGFATEAECEACQCD